METISSPAWQVTSAATVSAAIPLEVIDRGFGAFERGNLLFGRRDRRIAVTRVQIQVAIALGVAPQAFHAGNHEDRGLRDGRGQRRSLTVTLFAGMHTARGVSALVGLSLHEQAFAGGQAIVIEAGQRATAMQAWKRRDCSRLYVFAGILLLVGRASGLGLVINPKLVWSRDACGVRIQQAFVVRPQTQLDQGPRVGSELGLPAVVSLELGQGIFGGLVPNASGLAAEVMLLNQRALDFAGAFLIDRALPVRMGCALGAGLGMMLGTGRGMSL